MAATGIYIHIPFCPSRCDYCDFYTLTGCGQLFAPYARGVIAALDGAPLPPGSLVDSIYFGGGTPTMLGAGRLVEILTALHRQYAVAPDAEVTLEANPVALTPAMLSALRQGGFNRISFGVQSADAGQLRDLGRTHTTAGAAQAVALARQAGFANISLDIMLGLPHQTVAEVLNTVAFCAGLDVQHISAYMLRLEEGTPFAARYTEEDIDEDTQREIYLAAAAELERLGYRQYEISNFARPGYASRHNLKYWRCQPYLGVGPAAASFLNGRRFVFPRDIDAFLAAKDPWQLPVDEGPGGDWEETVMMALRLTDGLSRPALDRQFPGQQADTAALWQRADGLARRSPHLLLVDGAAVRLTREGFLLSNSIISHLLWG